MSELVLIGAALLLPVTAFLTLRQENVLHAIMGRALFGVAAALLYGLLGAPDVAVTEVLVGALLVTLLYVVVFKRTREIRIGALEEFCVGKECYRQIRDLCHKRGVRERTVHFSSYEEMLEALEEFLIDGVYLDRTPEGFVSIPERAPDGVARFVVPSEAWDLIELLGAEGREKG